jgi:2-dehydropantoate 2-reductase
LLTPSIAVCKDADEAAFVPEPENSKSHLLHIGAATPEEQLRIQYDYVVVCTKAIPEIENVVRPLITSGHTAIFLIQNGIDIELPFIEAYLNNPMASIVTTISSFMEGDRIVKYVGPDENKIGAHYHSGVDDDRSAHAAKEFFKIYKAGGSSNCILSTWIQWDRWKKLLWNASFNPVCTVLSMNVGEVHDSGAREALILPIMQVIQKLTKKTDKIHLDNTALMRHAWRSNAGKDYRPSMLLDRENGRVMEIEAVLGNAIRRANKIIKVPVPMMTMMYNLLKVVQWNIVKPVPSTDVEQQVIASFNAAGCEPI